MRSTKRIKISKIDLKRELQIITHCFVQKQELKQILSKTGTISSKLILGMSKLIILELSNTIPVPEESCLDGMSNYASSNTSTPWVSVPYLSQIPLRPSTLWEPEDFQVAVLLRLLAGKKRCLFT